MPWVIVTLMPQTWWLLVAVALAIVQAPISDRRLAGPSSETLSPDARLVSYLDEGSSELRVALTDGRNTGPIARVAVRDFVGSALSWDNRRLAFSSSVAGATAGVRVLDLDTRTAPQVLLEGAGIHPVEWSRDGTLLLVTVEVGDAVDLRLINVADRSVRSLKQLQVQSAYRLLALSPDARFVAYDAGVGTPRRRAAFLLSTGGAGRWS